MALILNPSEQANVKSITTEQQAIVTSANLTVTNLTTKQIPTTEDKEATNKKVFDYQHAVGNSYDSEIAALNGFVITTPLAEQDIIDRSNFTGRLFDTTLVNKDIVRIAEMDGGNTVAVPLSDSELNRSNGYAAIFSRLTSGLTTSVALTGTATQSVTNSSTTFTTNLNVTTLAGREFIMTGSGISFIGLCGSVTVVGLVYTVHFTFVSTFASGIISAGQFTGNWAGFTNTERTNKLSASGYQTVLNYYVLQVQNQVNAQKGYLNSQVSAINSNGDPGLAPTALTNCNSMLSSLTAYLVTTDISNTGIAGFTGNKNTRISQINARVAAISSARTPFYDKRYFWSVERAGSNGTLVQLDQLHLAVTAAEARVVTAEAKLATISAGVL